MKASRKVFLGRLLGMLAVAGTIVMPQASAAADDLVDIQSSFDNAFGTQPRVAKRYASALEAQVAALAGPERGRIGVAAVDLATGRSIAVLGDQPFPMASTSKAPATPIA